jgi:hypothetical protein
MDIYHLVHKLCAEIQKQIMGNQVIILLLRKLLKTLPWFGENHIYHKAIQQQDRFRLIVKKFKTKGSA